MAVCVCGWVGYCTILAWPPSWWQYPPSHGWGNLGSSFLPCGHALHRVHRLSLQYPSSLLRCHQHYLAVPAPTWLGKSYHFVTSFWLRIVQGALCVAAIPIAFFFLRCHHHFVAVPAVPWLGNLSNSFPLCGRALYRVCCTSCNTQRLSLLRCHHQYVAVPGISCLGKPSQFAPFISPCIVQGVLYVPAVPIACFSLCGMTILWQYPPSPGWGNLGSSFLPCSRAMYSMH